MYRRIMFPFPSKSEPRPTFEDIFFKHHVRLYEWALQLTGGDRPDAEDLVQELYVRFAGVGPVGEHIEDPAGYLFSALRNLHFARIRRARTSALDDLSLVDYDSADRSLRAVDRNGILFIREELHRVCDFLCERKNTSRSASIFILRYFLGYYPSEVVKVAQSTRVAIDKAIQAIRREARLDLERPGVLQQIGSGRDLKPRISQDFCDSDGLFLALRAKVFRSSTGECFSQTLLEKKYKDPAESFTTAELAHLVSCPACLDRANRMLGIPLLDERSPDETTGRDTPQGPGSSASAAPTLVSSPSKRKPQDPQRMRKRMQRRLQEVNQHRPLRLSIVVDGDVRASQKVTAQFSELLAELRPTEKPSFIEVFSEQNVCLAFVLVQTLVPEDGLLQIKEIELSDDRTLTVSISFASESPTIKVVYADPLIAWDAAWDENSAEVLPLNAQTFVDHFVSFTPWRILAELPRRFWTRIGGLLSLNMNPLLASAMLFGLCSIVCFLLWTRSGPQIPAETLLNRAEQSDVTAVQSARSEVVYQKVRITMAGHATERAIYRDPQKKRRPKQQQLAPKDQRLKDELNSVGVDWDEPLSATTFGNWHNSLLTKRDVVSRPGYNLLKLTTSTDRSGLITEESLTMRESDFHPVARTVELRNMGTVEIAELDYNVIPWSAADPNWFEPVANAAVSGPAMHETLRLPRVLSDLELDEAELTARTILNRLHADEGEAISLIRGPAGIDVKGVVDTDARKKELLSHFAMIPNVRASILSSEEIESHLLSRFGSGDRQPTQVFSTQSQPSSLQQYLREKKLAEDQLVPASDNLLDGSLRIVQLGLHLAELKSSFRESNQLSSDEQAKLGALYRNYSGSVTAGIYANKQILLALGFSNQVSAPQSSELEESDKAFDEDLRQYRQLCQEMVSTETRQPRPAQVIASEILGVGERIRLHIANMSVIAQKDNN